MHIYRSGRDPATTTSSTSLFTKKPPPTATTRPPQPTSTIPPPPRQGLFPSVEKSRRRVSKSFKKKRDRSCSTSSSEDSSSDTIPLPVFRTTPSSSSNKGNGVVKRGRSYSVVRAITNTTTQRSPPATTRTQDDVAPARFSTRRHQQQQQQQQELFLSDSTLESPVISSVVTKRTTLARQSLVSSATTPQQKTTKTLVVANRKKKSIATIRNKKSRLERLSFSSKDESSSSSSSDDEDCVGVPSKSSLSGLPTFRRESISTALVAATKRKSRSPPPPPPSCSPPSTPPPLRLPSRRREGAPPVMTVATESCVGESPRTKAMPARKDDERQKDSMIPHRSSSIVAAAGRGGSTSLATQDERPRMSIFDTTKEEADDDDDDASSLDTQNIPSYTKPLMVVPTRQKTSGAVGKATAVPEVTSGFSFSKQNIVKTTTTTTSTPVSNKTTAVQNDSGRGGSVVAIPVPPTTASRPVTWNRAKSTLNGTKRALVMGNVPTKKKATSSKSIQGMDLSAMASCAAVGGESVLETNGSAIPILSRANTTDDSNDEILKLAAKKTKLGGSNAPQINTTTLDVQLGLKDDDDRSDQECQSSWTPTAGKLLGKARVRYYSSSSDDDHPVHQSKTSRKSMNISDFLTEQRALRKERATCHDNTDTLAAFAGVVVRDDSGLAVTEATKRDSAMLPVKHASSTKSPTVMDGVTRRYEDLIALDSDDESMQGTCKRLEKENSLDVVDGVRRTTDSSRRDRPSRYFVDHELPPTTDDTTPSALKSRLISGESFAMRQSKHRGHGYRIQHVRSVLESATLLPRTNSAPNPNKTGSLSPFSSTDSRNSTPMKVGILKSGMRKRKFGPDSSSEDDVPILRSSKEKSNDIPSSWSTDCEVDSPPMSPRHPRHRLASFRSNQVSKRTRCGEPSAAPSTPVFDFIDEKPPTTKKMIGKKTRRPKRRTPAS